MAKFDTSKIEGFDTMTDTEKLAAVLGADIPDEIDLSQYVAKSVADKYATEASNYKKQLRDKMTDEEKAKEKAKADKEELETKYAELLKKPRLQKILQSFWHSKATMRHWLKIPHRLSLMVIWIKYSPIRRKQTMPMSEI